ncbi:Conserved_hypothetical protein [Hexamita inflata]|uniref:Uncharacterized protein n=1 Tax=Hexamita inflata TaxID=28002 RepID=A0AA86UVE9_9EUKA|nr:Conserved hypothetical protein [Hexamita inflata]
MFYSNKTNGITLTPHQVTATHSPPRWAKTGQGRVTIKIQHVNKATRSIKQVPAQIVEASHTIKNNRPGKNIMLLKLAIRNLIIYSQQFNQVLLNSFIYISKMISSITLVCRQLTFNHQQCSNNILLNNNQYSYCQKVNQLNNIKIDDSMYLTQKSNNNHLFLYNNVTQQSQISVQIYNVEVNTFALFGFSVKSQILLNSQISISLQYYVLTGALLCTNCDIEVNTCTLIFNASGQQISGMIIEPIEKIAIKYSFIQFRINSQNSSGLVNVINNSTTFIINECKLTGSNIIHSDNNGYIASSIYVDIILNISQFFVCVDSTQRFGLHTLTVTNGIEQVQCDLCGALFNVYGICSDDLQFGEDVNGIYKCVHPFEYINNQCICEYGYLLNGSKCVNIIDSITNMQNSEFNDKLQQINVSVNNMQQNIQVLEENLNNNITKMYISIYNNFTELKNFVNYVYQQSDNNLQTNTTILDNRIYNNISAVNLSFTALKNQLQQLNISAQTQNDKIRVDIASLDSNLKSNFTYLVNGLEEMDQRIYQNSSQLNIKLQTVQSTLQNNIISNFSQTQINLFENSTVLDWRIFNNISALNIIYQTMNTTIQQQQNDISNLIKYINCTNNQGYSMVNGSCIQVTCEIKGQQNINGVCQCSNIYSIVVSGQCVCPNNAIVIGGACVCNISGQIMKNGVCGCSTVDAFVDNGACICGVDSLNISNTCKCPTGSKLINGFCQCQSNQQNIVNGTCQYLINTTQFVCSQLQFETNFSLQNVNYYITSSSDFSSGYIFSTTTIIQDALIEIANNVYSSAYPLFQGQTSFTNIQIQFGTQMTTSGSILSNNNIIAVTQMNIISKNNCMLTVSSGQLNILSQSSNNANILNLCLNLSFAMSNGNITLINSIQNSFNIINYQISGIYQSFNCISLLSLTTSSTTITVNNLNFSPDIFTGGNYSSYLLSSLSQSFIHFTNIAIVYGNSSKYSEQLSQISSNDQYFGGLITYTVGTTVNVNQVIFKSHQNWNTMFVNNSGMLIGYVHQSTSNVSISNACMHIVIKSTGLFTYYGIVGLIEANLSLQQIQIQIHTQAVQSSFGMIGAQGVYQSSLTQSVVVNVIIVFNNSISTSSFHDIGPLFGANYAQIKYIRNIIVNNSNLGSQYSNGGLIGAVGHYNISMQNITTQYTNVTSFVHGVGGLIGYSKNCLLIIQDATINTVIIVSQSNYGIVLGFSDGSNVLDIQNSKSIGVNYINNVVQANCGSFTNTIGSITQC